MPGSYFFGGIEIVGKSIRRVLITNSKIATSAIDMNLNNITSVKDPILSQDAATKWYVDTSASRITSDVLTQFSGDVVHLEGTEYTEVSNLKAGSYVVCITPFEDGAPTATFAISKSSVYTVGFVFRLTGTPGLITGEQLDLIWLSGENLLLRKTGPGFDGNYLVNFNVKNVSALPAPPVIPTDAASKAYVDTMVRKELDVKFGGIKVFLSSNEYSKVINLRPGSYIISVTAIGITGGPTAAFSLSKNNSEGQANIQRTSSCAGDNTGEMLEITWPNNSMILLRKTGPSYNGEYLVDFNLKNFAFPPPELPSDSVTKEYVDNKIQEMMTKKYGGYKVTLRGTDFVDVANFRAGTYFITVNPLVLGGPTASFSLSKVSSFTPASSITRFSSHAGLETDEILDIIWPANSMIKLRKTAPYHDGEYIVDFNLKNLATNIPQVSNDIATKEYVDNIVNEKLNVKYGGIIISLNGTEFSSVVTPRLGSYFVSVASLTVGGATAAFVIAKPASNVDGHVIRFSSSSGVNTSEKLEMIWPANQGLMLRKTEPFHDGGYLVDFNLKNFSSAPPTPTLPSDTATKEFVENSIEQQMNVKHGGISVTLQNDLFSSVVALKAGSYIIAVSPTFNGGPTGVFAISKACMFGEGHIVVLSSQKGIETFDTLELKWPANDKLLLRKTSSGHDGNYNVDFNLKNFSTTEIPAKFPSDVATKAYVDNAMKNMLDIKYGGILVYLKDTEYTSIASIRTGSYLVNIVPQIYGGSTATFCISKTVHHQEGSIRRMLSVPAYDTEEQLELIWPANSKLLIRKTKIFHDGAYLVDLNLKNFTPNVEIPTLASDLATKDYVQGLINEKFDVHFSGIKVELSGILFTDVVALQAGSYTLNILPTIDGGPTASFSISKSSIVDSEAHITKTSSSASLSGENLELRWPPNAKIQLRKTSILYDGEYIVDFNLKNYSSLVETATLDSDTATKGFVLKQIRDHFSVKFGGTKVFLEGIEFKAIGALKPGSYHVLISPDSDGGASATFAISKSSQFSEGHIVRISSVQGLDYGEELILIWPESSQLLIRKTKIENNGFYNIQI